MILLENKELHIIHVSKTMLMPGLNEVTSEKWNEIKLHPLIKHRFDEDKLVIKGTEEQYSKGLSGFDAKGAIKIIKETFRKDMLEQWLENEKRPQVVKTINAQIKEISLKSKEAISDAEDDENPIFR